MKKVWVLEKWSTRDTVIKALEENFSICDELDKDENSDKENNLKFRKRLEEKLAIAQDPNFTGKWTGMVGRSNYKQFCRDALDDIKWGRKEGYKFRVVYAWIEDDSDTWIGYVNPTENEGVLRYLYVQSKY